MNIVIPPLYGIGDVLMSTPAVRNLKERLGARITYLHMFRTTWDIARENPHIEEHLHFPFLERSRLAGMRFLLGLRGRFDASVSFYPSNRRDYNLAAYILGSPVRIGHRYVLRDRAELNFLKNRTVLEDDTLHNVEEDLRLLKFLGIEDPVPYALEVYLRAEEKEAADRWVREAGAEGRQLVGFHPGSSLFKAHAKKRWPLDKYAELIREMAGDDPDITFLLFGGPEERGLKEEVAAATGLPERLRTVEMASIRETAAVMAHCGLFVANDSGLMHLAAALQVPVVGIFGPTSPVWLAPWKCPHRVVRLGECGPCFRYSPLPQRCAEGTDFSCVREIQVGEVLEAARSLLRESAAGD
jgi:heptosyltransferase-2